MPLSNTVRRRLEAQGFCNLDDATLSELAPWMRWSPALCALGMASGTALQSPTALWVLAATAFLGTVLPFHPFDLLFNHGIRYLAGTRPLPRNTAQRRFACGVASAWLLGTGWAFYSGATTAGFVLGGALTAVAAIVSVSHFCIPSALYNTLIRGRT